MAAGGGLSYEKLLRPLLFRIDPETAHNLAVRAIAMGLVRGKLLTDPRLEVTAAGITFPNPLGLAAGVDKNGVALNRWRGMGFGSAEIGTVTAHPQPGNPKPRMFRYPDQHAVVNRLGFNNSGCRDAAIALQGHRAGIPIGINLGKSKRTPVEDAAADYLTSFRHLAKFADYVTVNVSSPNTPGLRSLQSVDALREILEPLILENHLAKPIFVKIAPDLHFDDITAVAELCGELRLGGIIATNTTLDHSALPRGRDQNGGLSGEPLREKSNAVLRHLKAVSPPGLALVGVGGIFSGRDLYEKLALGASWAQVYTGWIYGGPMMPYRTLLEYLGLKG